MSVMGDRVRKVVMCKAGLKALNLRPQARQAGPQGFESPSPLAAEP